VEDDVNDPSAPAKWYVWYYERCDPEFAADWWLRGLESARQWLRMTQSATVSAQDVSSLLAVAKADQQSGTVWNLMAMSIYFWAEKNGHHVPPIENFFDRGS
jgi:hypothetical protein